MTKFNTVAIIILPWILSRIRQAQNKCKIYAIHVKYDYLGILNWFAPNVVEYYATITRIMHHKFEKYVNTSNVFLYI